MKKALIIHGFRGNPEENWFPWLKQQLEEQDYEVRIPAFPTPEGQSLEAWLEALEEHHDWIDGQTVVIGHSVGATFLLSLLEKLEKPVRATYLVAGFTGKLADEAMNEHNKTFAEKDFSWKKIRKNAGKVFVYHGTNDPYVSVDKAVELGAKLQTSVSFIEHAGHFNEKAGYTEFGKLLEDILSLDILSYEEFQKLDARIGTIKLVEEVADADKLLRFEIDFGLPLLSPTSPEATRESSPRIKSGAGSQAGEQESGARGDIEVLPFNKEEYRGRDVRQIVSGIREFFPDHKSLEGKQALYVLNLAPREIKGITSYGMLMAVDGKDGAPVFLVPENDVNPGSAVR